MSTRMLYFSIALGMLSLVGLTACSAFKQSPPKSRTYSIGRASFSPDGQSIAFSISDGQTEAIYRMKKDGTDLNRLTASANMVYHHPVFSPDGSTIAYFATKRYDKPASIYLMNADGSNPRLLVSGKVDYRDPVFSHDGQRIFFLGSGFFGHYSRIAQSHPHELDIFSVRLDGSDLKAVTNQKFYQISEPSLSPEDKQLLFQRYEPGKDSLLLLNVEDPLCIQPIRPNLDAFQADRVKKPLTFDSLYYPQFSPDGKSILFTWAGHYQGYFGHDIYLMDIETRIAKRLTDLHSFLTAPVFAPDGKTILFLKDINRDPGRDSQFELWQVNSDGTFPRKINIPVVRDLQSAH